MTPLSRRDLEILECVDSLPSVSAIARELDVSQPAISTRLAALERDCGARLIRRSPTGFTPEPAGLVLAQAARRALVAMDGADDTFASVHRFSDDAAPARPAPERVHIAASMTIAEHLLPAWMSQLREQHHVSVTVTNSASAAKRVAAGRAEIGFIEGAFAPASLRSWVIGGDELVVIASPDLELPAAAALASTVEPSAAVSPISGAELLSMPLVIREHGSGTRQVLSRALRAEGLTLPANLAQVNSAAAIVEAVRHGAVAVVPWQTVKAAVTQGEFVTVATSLHLERTLRMVTKPGVRLSPIARRLVRLVRLRTAN